MVEFDDLNPVIKYTQISNTLSYQIRDSTILNNLQPLLTESSLFVRHCGLLREVVEYRG